jgi:hypothetical protein
VSVLTKIDKSASGILIVCGECPYWFAFAFTMGAAHDSACSHESRVHPGSKAASTRRTVWTGRHADIRPM